MDTYHVTFPNLTTVQIPAVAATAIARAKAKYAEPLWQFRAEGVLKLGAHQWISPQDVATAQQIFDLHPGGFVALGWKLFPRGWAGAAEAYFVDTLRYPHHPRHLGLGVIPLVDEDKGSQQIGWVRIEQATAMDHNFAIFVQFTVLDLFAPRPLPPEYA